MDNFGLVALVALYCNGMASNSWYVLEMIAVKYFSSALALCYSSVGFIFQVLWSTRLKEIKLSED